MKAVVPAGCLAAGLAIGLVIGNRAGISPDGRGAGPAPERAAPSRPERAALPATGRADINRIRRAAPSELPRLARQVLEIADPVEMRRHLTEVLLNMNPENWQEIVAGFGNLSRDTGVDAADEWKLALFRSGQIAGADAMDVYLAQGLEKSGQQGWHTLYGWATKDPRGALEWLAEAEAAGHPTGSSCYTAIIAGAALTSPADAIGLLEQIPSALRRDCAGDLVWNVVRNSGTDGLDPLLGFAATLDTTSPDNSRMANDILREASEKLLWQADQARDVGQACDAVLKLAGYGLDPTRGTYQAIRKYRYYAIADKLTLVETIRAAPEASGLDLPHLASAVLATMNDGNGDAAALREWIERNPDSPLVPLVLKRAETN